MERLQKLIAQYGYTSRRKAEDLIRKKKVMVNGKIITELGTKVDSNDVISIDGIIINKDIKHEYYILNKPRSVLSSVEDNRGRITVVDLINTDARIYPIGRLDYDTTGLILLTNDGDFANTLMHPKFQIEKTYIAKINKILDKDEIHQIKKGILIDNRKVEVRKLKIKNINKEKNTMILELTIIEGRNHIVKKIFNELNIEVLKLSRIGYGFLDIKDLKSGEYRTLTIKEIKKLYSLAKNK
ncbi:MAG: pseudouridine synthase [Bacilli bacterium]